MSVLTVAGLSLALLGACTMLPANRGEFTGRFNDRSADPIGEELGFPNWPAPPEEIEVLLAREAFEIKSRVGAGAGLTGAQKLMAHFPSAGIDVPFKWKRMDGRWKPLIGRLDGINNSPRKEIAAWRIQQLFLEPADYVVPLSVTYAFEVGIEGDDSEPTLDGTKCVLGTLSVWLNDVTVPDLVLEDHRFARDPRYANSLSNLNLLTYLIAHHDGRRGNLMISTHEDHPQVFAIDNGVAFGGIFYNWFVRNWSDLHVPALRRASIDRLRTLKRSDLESRLGVVAQLSLGKDGVYRNVPLRSNLDPSRGVRIAEESIQFGLTDGEIEDVWRRVEELIDDVDDGRIPVF